MAAGEEVEESGEVGTVEWLQRHHIPAFIAGVSLILLLVLLDRGMQTSLGLAIVGEEIVSPVRLTLIGLGTGYYLADAIQQQNSGVVVFHAGAFLTLLALSVWSLQVQPVGLVLATAVVFSFSMRISSIVDSHEDIRDAFEGLSRDLSRAGIVFLVFVQYSVSIYFWSGTQLQSFAFIDKVMIVGVVLVVLILSLRGTWLFTGWGESEEGSR